MTSTLTEPLPHADAADAAGTAVAAGGAQGPGAPATVSGSLTAALRRSAEIERRIAVEPRASRILTGDRPTGDLHLCLYFGTLRNRAAAGRGGGTVRPDRRLP